MRSLACFLALSLASCVSPPTAKVESTHGVVRAPTFEEAERVAGYLDRLHPSIHALLPGTRDPRVEVWLQDRLRLFWLLRPSEEVVALNYDAWDRIHLSRDSEFLSEDLAHELVHLMLDASWNVLPPVLEEGLADHVGLSLHPRLAPSFRAGRLVRALGGLGGYRGRIQFVRAAPNGAEAVEFHWVTPPEDRVDPVEALRPAVHEISPHARATSKRAFYGLGYLLVARIVQRVGYEGLHRLCLETSARGLSTIPAERLLALAELDERHESWIAAIHEAMGEPELVALVHQQGDELARMVAEACRDAFPTFDGRTFLARYLPSLSLGVEGARVELHLIPPFREAFVAEWSAPANGVLHAR